MTICHYFVKMIFYHILLKVPFTRFISSLPTWLMIYRYFKPMLVSYRNQPANIPAHESAGFSMIIKLGLNGSKQQQSSNFMPSFTKNSRHPIIDSVNSLK